jgi:prophage regulatory protein
MSFLHRIYLIKVTPTNATERLGVTTMSQTPALSQGERRILRLDEVEAKSGFKRAHIYALMKKGEFPQALRLGVRAVGWDSAEVDHWISERLKNRVLSTLPRNA